MSKDEMSSKTAISHLRRIKRVSETRQFLSSKINYTRIQFYSKSVHGPVLTNINYWRKLIIHESKKHFTSRDVSMMISYGFCISQKLFLK